jgi:methylated-DNA-[protein]-cysteine S-methyltransferase
MTTMPTGTRTTPLTATSTTTSTTTESAVTAADGAEVAAWTMETPVGPLAVLATGERVIAAGFCPVDDLLVRLPQRHRQLELVAVDHLGPISDAVTRFVGGDIDALDTIPVDQAGTDLQQQVWSGLRAIPAGRTRTYTELAASTSRPAAVRAAGTACGRNLVAPIVPCHRALRSDGTLGGYYYGLDVKRWLLAHEAANATGTGA